MGRENTEDVMGGFHGPRLEGDHVISAIFYWQKLSHLVPPDCKGVRKYSMNGCLEEKKMGFSDNMTVCYVTAQSWLLYMIVCCMMKCCSMRSCICSPMGRHCQGMPLVCVGTYCDGSTMMKSINPALWELSVIK